MHINLLILNVLKIKMSKNKKVCYFEEKESGSVIFRKNSSCMKNLTKIIKR